MKIYRNTALVLAIISVNLFAHAQTLPPLPEEIDYEEVYNMADVGQKPEFPKGESGLFRYLSENIRYPAMAREDGISGRVTINFVISKTGEIKDIELVQSLREDCDEEAIRIVRNMPKWSPGRINDKPVNVRYTLPVNYTLQ